jgi:hypothetical protein
VTDLDPTLRLTGTSVSAPLSKSGQMKRRIDVPTTYRAAVLLSTTAVLACATQPKVAPRPPPAPSVEANQSLPITKIRFYESGVAQFERSGKVRGDSIVLLPTANIDDVLRTLSIRRGPNLIPDYSVSFDTLVLAQAARAKADLPVETRPGFEYVDFVRSLTGERVELIFRGRPVRGRLIELVPLEKEPTPTPEAEAAGGTGKSVNTKAKRTAAASATHPDPPVWHDFELTLLTDQGALERYPSPKITGLRAVDPAAMSRVQRAVTAMSAQAAEASRAVRINGLQGEPVSVTYLTEAPLVRITYRLDTGDGLHADRLEGLALVHNVTDETWKSVAIEISNEDLDTAVVPFAAPRYSERPLHGTKPGDPGLVPQLGNRSADSLAAATPEPAPSRPDTTKPAVPRRAKPLTNSGSPRLPSYGQRPASGGAGYVYAAPKPATLPEHTSALLPVVDASVMTEPGVWFPFGSTDGRAVVRIQNASPMPIPAGTLSVFDARDFRGETELSQLEVGQYGYFDYANEPGLRLTQLASPTPTRTYRAVTWSDDVLRTRWVEKVSRTIELTNSTQRNLTAFVSLQALAGAVVTGADGIDTNSSGQPIVATLRVPAAARVERTLVVEQERTGAEGYENLDVDSVSPLVEQPWLPAASRAALTEAIRILLTKQALSDRKERVEHDVNSLEETINRLPVSDTSQPGPIAIRFVQLEAERSALQRQANQLEQAIESRNGELKKALGKLRSP